MQEPEAELENFRQKWRQEVSARRGAKSTASNGARPTPSSSGPGRPTTKSDGPHSTAPAPVPVVVPTHIEDQVQDYTPRTFHDLEDKEEHLKLDNGSTREKAFPKEPRSALDHYEQAVEKEAQGSLGDSVSLYRKAFKLDDRVHELYTNKHFPQRPKATQTTTTSSSSVPAPEPTSTSATTATPPATISELIESFANCAISGETAASEDDGSHRLAAECHLADLPAEILLEILRQTALSDVATYASLSLVCKRLAYTVSREDSIWRAVVLGRHQGFAAMHYRYACNIAGLPLPPSLPLPPLTDLTPAAYPTHRAQFRQRPRVRFNGCYISTCNYPRALANTSHYNWTSPVVIVTYYRYLRFFRDGSLISLLTTAAPADVVHHMRREHLHRSHSGALPQTVMKDALRGRWRLSGPAGVAADADAAAAAAVHDGKGVGEYAIEHGVEGEEAEGELHIETEGVIPRYLYKMQLKLASAGRREGPRNNKLEWMGFWSYHRMTGDWAEFGLRNDRPFYFSRVKSYGAGA